MNALCWHGKGDIRCDTVDDPTIEDDQDMIIKVTERCCNLVDLVVDIPAARMSISLARAFLTVRYVPIYEMPDRASATWTHRQLPIRRSFHHACAPRAGEQALRGAASLRL